VSAKFKVAQQFLASVAEGPAPLVAAVGLDNLAEPMAHIADADGETECVDFSPVGGIIPH
jgi:hypothetical protein